MDAQQRIQGQRDESLILMWELIKNKGLQYIHFFTPFSSALTARSSVDLGSIVPLTAIVSGAITNLER
jgi:hypothetical protein